VECPSLPVRARGTKRHGRPPRRRRGLSRIANVSEPTNKAPGSMHPVDAAALAGGLAHELRNPLSTVMVNLTLLAEDLQDRTNEPERLRVRALKKVETLKHEAERLKNLCDDFLNLVGPCRLDRKPVDLNGIVARHVEFLELLARRAGIDLIDACSDMPVMCPVDESLIRQAILNLMLNAQQAMPDGGRLEVATDIDRGSAVVRVSDSGPGIPPEHRDRIMQPFFSTKTGGTGLGLAITRRIIEEHGGTLEFDAEVGSGTTFTIRLPVDAPNVT